MKNFLKLITVLFFTIILSITSLFLACKNRVGDSSSNVDLNIDKSISSEISIGIQQSESEKHIVEAFIEGFNKEYPNVKIKIIELSGNYTEALMAKVRTNSVPDVIWVRDEDVSYYASNKFLLNLDDYMKVDNFDDAQYYSSMMQLGKINQIGSQYMLPRDYNKIVVYYNKDLLSNAGVTASNSLYPKDDWTWDQFLELCKELKSKLPDGVYPVDAMLTWAPIYNTFIKSFGGSIIDENGNPVFDSEKSVKGLNALTNIFDKGYTINPANKTEDIFLSGKSAMWFSTRPSISNIEAQNISYNAVSFPFVGENGYIGTGASGYSVYAKSSQKNLSYLFVKSMLSKYSQELFSKTGNAVPVRKDLATTGKWLTSPNDIVFFNHYAFINYPQRDSLTDYLKNIKVEYHADVNSSILDLLDNYMGWSDKTTAKNKTKVLSDFKTKINRILTSD